MEMLIVVAIIAILAALLLPAIGNARRSAMRVAMGNDLQTISAALGAYKADYDDFPRLPGPATIDPLKKGFDGAIVLCQALVGPSDRDDLDDDDGNGKELTVIAAEKKDLGGRKRHGGKVYGPYVQTDRFPMKIVVDETDTLPSDMDGNVYERESYSVILGQDRQPILYFPRSTAKPNIRLVATGAGALQPYADKSDTARYDLRDNLGPTMPADKIGPFMREHDPVETNAMLRMRLLLGDTRGLAVGSASDGAIQGDEKDIDLEFLLWSAGPDELFGPNASDAGDRNVIDLPDVLKCDDVTNFR